MLNDFLKYKIIFILILMCSSCNYYSFMQSYRGDMPQPVSQLISDNIFFELENWIAEAHIPHQLSLKKVFLQSLVLDRTRDNRIMYFNLPFSNHQIKDFDSSLHKALGNFTSKNIANQNLVWTNKNLDYSFGLKMFDPNELIHENLVNFIEPDVDETILLPLIAYRGNTKDSKKDRNLSRYSLMLVVSFVIFDRNQIYYAKSVGMTKISRMDNYVNPKDTQFLQSEWDYLVYEALRPLLEKGVELEIVSREK